MRARQPCRTAAAPDAARPAPWCATAALAALQRGSAARPIEPARQLACLAPAVIAADAPGPERDDLQESPDDCRILHELDDVAVLARGGMKVARGHEGV